MIDNRCRAVTVSPDTDLCRISKRAGYHVEFVVSKDGASERESAEVEDGASERESSLLEDAAKEQEPTMLAAGRGEEFAIGNQAVDVREEQDRKNI